MIYVFVLCFLLGYTAARVAEDEYAPWVNWVSGTIWALALYGLIHFGNALLIHILGP